MTDNSTKTEKNATLRPALVIPKKVYQYLEEAYPATKGNSAYRGLLAKLIRYEYATRSSDDPSEANRHGGSEVISHTYLCRLVGHPNERHFASGEFLLDFKEDVLPDFRWSTYSSVDGKAREIISTGVSDETLDAVFEIIREAGQEAPLVFYEDGSTVNKGNTSKYYKAMENYALDPHLS